MTDETVAYMGWGISAQEQIDGLRREVRELRDENAKLLAARDTWAENDAKLRELVRDLWMQLLNAYDRKEVDEFADRMRELGVEVDA